MLLHDLALGDADASVEADRHAVITPGGTWSRSRLRHEVGRLAVAITSLAPLGGRIAIAADSRPEVVALLLAIPAAGRVAVPLNTRLRPAEVADQLQALDASALCGTAEELSRLATVTRGLTTVGLDPGTGDISLGALAAMPPTTAAATAVLSPPPDDAPAWIVFSSGTTGRAKGVVLTARSLAAAVAATAAARPLADDDVYLYPFPLYHVSAYNVLHALSRGRPVVLPRRFDAAAICALADEHGVTAMSLAPTMLRMLLDHRRQLDEPASVLTTLRTIAYGAAPMAPALLAEADAALGVDFAQGYGMTELSGNAVFLPPEDHRRGLAGEDRLLRAAGRAAPGVELCTIDEAGRSVPDGQPGEVWVRAAQVCAGYWDDPEATAEAITADGWLRTGDVGVLDADGLLTIVDRAKDIIITGGENVVSREVEDAVGAHPAVARVAVVGVPDERWGEAVCAVVVLRSDLAGADHAALAADIRRQASEHLARYKVPKRVEVVDDLPVNAAGKVQKAEIRRRLGPVPG